MSPSSLSDFRLGSIEPLDRRLEISLLGDYSIVFEVGLKVFLTRPLLRLGKVSLRGIKTID